jgi:ribosome-binding protein aMBF1 (putative translation factor)
MKPDTDTGSSSATLNAISSAILRAAAAPGSGYHGAGATSFVRSFGIGLRELREARGWSQERLAENADLNRSYIGEIERGCAVASLATIAKLALALEVAPSTLVTRGEKICQLNHAD